MAADVARLVYPVGDFGPLPRGLTAIYGLIDPRDGRVRYVGMSAHPSRRMMEHLKPSRLQANTQKTAWIKKLVRAGHPPTLSILEVVNVSEWQAAECKWIARFGKQLTNGSPGGQGGGITPEVREKISARNRGRVVSEEARRNIGAASRGRQFSAETRAKMSASGKARGFSDAHRGRLAEAAKRRESLKTPEQRTAIAEKIRARVLASSPETRKRQSDAAKRRCARQAEERARGD